MLDQLYFRFRRFTLGRLTTLALSILTGPPVAQASTDVPLPQPPTFSIRPPAMQIKAYTMDALLETGPDDSPALRIQLTWTTADKVVWTVLNGKTWDRVLRGERQAKLPGGIRTCTGWGTPRSVCHFHDGAITFTAPVSNKVGKTVQGSLRFKDSTTAQEVVLPFTATVRRGYLGLRHEV